MPNRAMMMMTVSWGARPARRASSALVVSQWVPSKCEKILGRFRSWHSQLTDVITITAAVAVAMNQDFIRSANIATERCASAASDSFQPPLHLSITAALNRVRCKRLLAGGLRHYTSGIRKSWQYSRWRKESHVSTRLLRRTPIRGICRHEITVMLKIEINLYEAAKKLRLLRFNRKGLHHRICRRRIPHSLKLGQANLRQYELTS